MKKLSLLMMLVAILTTGSYAQKESDCGPKWGEDSVACRENISIFGVRLQSEQWEGAARQWQKIFDVCPYHDEGIVYINGYKVYKELLEANQDSARERAIKDTIFLIYDKRLECYGRKKSVLWRYGLDMLRWDAINKYNDVVDVVNEYFEKETPGKIPEIMFKVYFQAVDIQLVKKEINNPEFVDEYLKVSDLILREMNNGGDSTKLMQMQNFIDSKFVKRIDNCEELVQTVEKSRETWPADGEERAEVLNKWLKVLRFRKCADTDLYREMASESFELNPSCEAARAMIKLYLDVEDVSTAFNYAKQATELCAGTDDEAAAYLTAAKIALQMGSTSSAMTYGKKAAAAGESEGYKVVAQAITMFAGTCGNSTIERKSVYWLASDYYKKATGVEDKYKANYPSTTEIFNAGLDEEGSYTVPCIGETTTVRSK